MVKRWFERVWLSVGLFVVISAVVICWWKCGGKEDVKELSGIIVAVLTALGTYIATETSNFNKEGEEERVLLLSLKEELECFAGRELVEIQNILDWTCEKGKYFPVNREYKFPVYENSAGKLGLIGSEDIRKNIVKSYSRIFVLLNSITYTDRRYNKEEEIYYATQRPETIFNNRIEGLRVISSGQRNDLISLKSDIENLVNETKKYVK